MSALALVPLLGLSACGHEATVVVLGPDRPELDRFVDGKILGSDQDRLYLSGDDGRTLEVKREHIEDIDHPGSLLAVAGGLTVLPICASGDSLSLDSVPVLCIGTLAATAWGIYLNTRSRSAASKVIDERARRDDLRPYLPAPVYAPAPTYQPAPVYQPAPPYQPAPVPLDPAKAQPSAPASEPSSTESVD